MPRIVKFKPEGRDRSAVALICESMTEAADYLVERREAGKLITSVFGLSFEAESKLHRGDDSLVARADALLASIEAESPIDESARALARTMAGGLADVPAYLSGSPVAMRQRMRREEKAPLRIAVDVTSSGGIGHATLERRGVAALALLRKLESAGHAVELWLVGGLGGTRNGFAFVRMDTSPMDLARSCWALTSHEFTRQCAYTLAQTVAEKVIGGWPWDNKQWCGHETGPRDAYAMALGVESKDILALPPIYSTESVVFGSDKAAASWVQERYAEAIAMARQGRE